MAINISSYTFGWLSWLTSHMALALNKKDINSLTHTVMLKRYNLYIVPTLQSL